MNQKKKIIRTNPPESFWNWDLKNAISCFFRIFIKWNNVKENAVVSCLFYQSLRAISKVQC